MRTTQKFWAILIIGVLLPLLLIYPAKLQLFDPFEQRLLDIRFKYFGMNHAPSDEIIIILIDEQTLEMLGRWPLKRDLYSPILAYLNANKIEGRGPKAILFDILFTEPTRINPLLLEAAQHFQQIYQQTIAAQGASHPASALLKGYQEYLLQALADSNVDSQLSQGMQQFGDIYNNIQFLLNRDETGTPLAPRPLPDHISALRAMVNGPYRDSLIQTLQYNDFITPIPEISHSGKGLSVANFDADSDGIYRRNRLAFSYDQQIFLSFAINAYLEARGIDAEEIDLVSDDQLRIRDQKIPLYQGIYHLNFYSKPFRQESFAWVHAMGQQLLSGELGGDPQKFFQQLSDYDDKIIFIGTSASATYDLKPNPMSADAPGVFLHATILSNLLEHHFLYHLEAWQSYAITLTMTILLALLIISYNSIWAQIILPLTLFSGFILSSILLFKWWGIVVNMTLPLLGATLALLASLAFFSFTAGKDRRFLKSAFQNYISPALIDIMANQGTLPKLGGDVGERTAFFTDIAGFSTFSEQLNATKLVSLLNEYLNEMTEILLHENGTLDKYEGDAIIAFFGAPMPLEDHAIRACHTAIQMQSTLAQLRIRWRHEGDKWPTVVHSMSMRIGINSGEIVTGNMGSYRRMNYTMMGDAVNLAARLESAAKQYGVFILISEATYLLLNDQFAVRQLDTIRVVGKAQPITTYELLALKTQLTDEIQQLITHFEQGRHYYLKQQWQLAIESFTRAQALEGCRFPDLKLTVDPSQIYLLRCRGYLQHPPEPGWQGVHTLTNK